MLCKVSAILFSAEWVVQSCALFLIRLTIPQTLMLTNLTSFTGHSNFGLMFAVKVIHKVDDFDRLYLGPKHSKLQRIKFLTNEQLGEKHEMYDFRKCWQTLTASLFFNGEFHTNKKDGALGEC